MRLLILLLLPLLLTPVLAEEDVPRLIWAHVGEDTLTIALADNSSADAFYTLLQEGDVTIDMADYAHFEKVGDLGTTLPTNDTRITTTPGDLILYLGHNITLYYDENTWSFTLLGHVQDKTAEELRAILGDGDVTITFSASAPVGEAE